jgi:hypothetical protein
VLKLNKLAIPSPNDQIQPSEHLEQGFKSFLSYSSDVRKPAQTPILREFGNGLLSKRENDPSQDQNLLGNKLITFKKLTDFDNAHDQAIHDFPFLNQVESLSPDKPRSLLAPETKIKIINPSELEARNEQMSHQPAKNCCKKHQPEKRITRQQNSGFAFTGLGAGILKSAILKCLQPTLFKEVRNAMG